MNVNLVFFLGWVYYLCLYYSYVKFKISYIDLLNVEFKKGLVILGFCVIMEFSLKFFFFFILVVLVYLKCF